MRETVIFLLFCLIINQVTSTVPLNLPKTTTPATTTTKLPKWSTYGLKNSTVKPVKDNAYLATLVNMPPKDKSKDKKVITKADGNKTNTEIIKKECLNTTRVLYAEELFRNSSKENEISSSVEISVKGSIKALNATEIKNKNFKSKMNNTELKKGVKLQELMKPFEVIAKPKPNNTDVQPISFDLPPTMIPIFRPKPNLTKNQVTKDSVEAILIKPEEPTLEDNAKSSKETQSNVNPNPAVIPFNIPCHRASDVLDETPLKTETPHYARSNLKSKPKVDSPITQEPNQVERPQKLDTDDVAIVFKPKNISLLNVYGDMLKKITLTVLVPYHMSKLGT